jgi:DUF1680 family protein
VDVRRTFAPGDVIDLALPIEPRFSWPDARVDALRGTVAVERGPLVLCIESADLPDGVALDDVRLDAARLPASDGDGARVRAVVVAPGPAASGRPPYGPATAPVPERTIDVPLVPYHRWAERGPSAMRVFTPTADAVTTPPEVAHR